MVSKGHLCFYSFSFQREELWSRLPKKCYTNFFCKCNFRIFAKLANVQKKSTYLSCGPTDLYFCNFLPSPNAIYIHCKFPIKYMVPRVYEMMSYEDFKKNVCVCRYPPQILKVNSSDEFELSLSWVELSRAKLQKFRAEPGHFNFWAGTKPTIFLH